MAAPAISQLMPLPAFLRLLRRHGADPRYRGRVRARILTGALLEPLRRWEALRWGRRLRDTPIDASPVFVLGYGRSGTTHLHYLFWQDPKFGMVTNYLANLYPVALSGRGWLERVLAARIPATRPMDNVAITLDAPQEEEIALVNATEHAPLHFMSFPRAMPDLYDRYVCDLRSDAATFAAWKDAYLAVLRKATLLSGGKRLVLKAPTNTGRVPTLLELFPAAKFVHIVRDPYRVYQSMRNLYRKILPAQVLQELDWERVEAWTVDAYVRLVSRYLEDRARIPSGNLVEVTYEELDDRPLEVMQRIYERLDLGDFESVRPRMASYLAQLGQFEKNRFDYPAEVIETVNAHWGFAFDAFGYERRAPGVRAEGGV
jgi:omega-hydroxy-beta-dihydromenaquinone-9 sulfotransferase